MKALLTILILAALASAQAWGPAGVPLDWRGLGLTWMESSKFTSAGATNYLSMTSSAAADSLVWTQTGTPGDRDMAVKFVQDDGTVAYFQYDDALNWWDFGRSSGGKVVAAILYAGSGGTTQLTDGVVQTTSSDLTIDASATGAATLNLNVDGDGDILRNYSARSYFKYDTEFGQVGVTDTLISNCSYNAFNGHMSVDTLQHDAVFGQIRYINADYSALATDWQIIATDTCRVTLPALSVAYDLITAATGYGLQLDIFCSAAAACTISTVADSIYGNVEVVLTPGDNASLRAGEDWWILR